LQIINQYCVQIERSQLLAGFAGRKDGRHSEMEKPTIVPSDDDTKRAKARINLARASILLMDNAWGLELLAGIFTGFGAKQLYRCSSVASANEIVHHHSIDIIVSDAVLQDEDVYEFLRALRRSADNDINRFTPVIVLSAHTAMRKVSEARDCGANLFVAKPISPTIIMERIRWVAAAKRKYLETQSYAGPDRRFHDDGPPQDMVGRRQGDTEQYQAAAAAGVAA
jgi:CheY-like chemotaxis protein